VGQEIPSQDTVTSTHDSTRFSRSSGRPAGTS
jgi:hypothetical protein